MRISQTHEFFNMADYFLDRNIRQGRGHKIAIYSEHRNYTYNDLQKMVNKNANGLREIAVRVDDRLMILMLDVPQFYAMFWGAVRIGAIPVPVNTMLTPEDYEYYLNDSRARVLAVSEELLPLVRQIKGDLYYLRDLIVISETEGAHIPFRQKYRHSPSTIKTEYTTRDDAGFWIYSSGSTGSLFLGLTALFWIGHRLCSTWLAYCTEPYRPLLHAQPVRFVVVPLLVTAGCFGVFLPSDAAFPWTRGERVVGLAILDYALVTYHFAAQHFGALSLYRTRVGRGACAHTRRMDRLFALGVGGVLVFLADILAGAVTYHDLWVGRWLVPAWLASAQDGVRQGATLALLGVTAAMLFAEARAPRRSLPRVLYVLGIAAMVAIALRPRSVFLFLVIWNAQHWILASGLGSQTPRGEPAPMRGAVRRVLHMLNTRPWASLWSSGPLPTSRWIRPRRGRSTSTQLRWVRWVVARRTSSRIRSRGAQSSRCSRTSHRNRLLYRIWLLTIQGHCNRASIRT